MIKNRKILISIIHLQCLFYYQALHFLRQQTDQKSLNTICDVLSFLAISTKTCEAVLKRFAAGTI